jgi:hypothetical protein
MSPPIAASAYIPGDCNLNTEEVTLRRRAGYVGLAAYFIALGLCLSLTHMTRWRILVFPAAYIAAIGFLQAKYRFCVAYGMTGRQNAEPGSKQAHTVTSEVALAKDRHRARVIKLQALAIAAAMAAVTFFLPSINVR